jgi:Carboxypeptidase regulatory-like domain/Tetratricopeptide repeat
MGRSFGLFAISAIVLLSPVSLDAFQMNNGNPLNRNRQLSGNVYYGDTHEPADHVQVQITTSEGEVHGPATTTSSGYFDFRDLTLGTYEITITVPGYETYQESEELTFTSVQGVVIYLTPNGKASGNTPPAEEKEQEVSAHELSMPQKARDLMESGKKKLYMAKDAKGALADFQQATEAAPGYYEAYYQMAMAQVTLGNMGVAMSLMEKSEELSEGKYSEAAVGLGTILLDNGKIAEADKKIRHGVELDATYWLGYYELGRVELAENEIDDAKKSAEQARSLAPNEAPVYRLLTKIDLEKKDYQGALKDLDGYIKLDPDSPLGTRAKQLRQEVAQKAASPN